MKPVSFNFDVDPESGVKGGAAEYKNEYDSHLMKIASSLEASVSEKGLALSFGSEVSAKFQGKEIYSTSTKFVPPNKFIYGFKPTPIAFDIGDDHIEGELSFEAEAVFDADPDKRPYTYDLSPQKVYVVKWKSSIKLEDVLVPIAILGGVVLTAVIIIEVAPILLAAVAVDGAIGGTAIATGAAATGSSATLSSLISFSTAAEFMGIILPALIK
jgi:hypothetical protein